MKYIINCFDFLINFIRTIYDIICNFFESTILLMKYIALVSDLAFDFILALPNWLQSFATITITISILYLILGRRTGGSHE